MSILGNAAGWLGNNADWIGAGVGLAGSAGLFGTPDGQQTQQSSSSTREPWSGALPMINGAMQDVNDLYSSNAGTEYYPGASTAGMGSDTSTAYNQIRDRAMGGSSLNDAANSGLENIINNPQQAQGYGQFQGGQGGPGNSYLNQAANNGSQYQASQGGDNFNQYMGGNNPHLDQMVQNAMQKVGDNTNATFNNAGRYGSGKNMDMFIESTGDVANSMYGAQYNSDRDRGLNAAQGYSQNEQQDLGRQATQGQQNSQNQLNAGQGLNNQYNQGQDRALNATNYNNQFNQNQGQQQLNAIGMAGGVAQNDYTDAGKLLGIGQGVESYQNQQIQDDTNRFNFYQQQPFNRMNDYANTAMNFGNLGGTSTGGGTATGAAPTFTQNAGNWMSAGQGISGLFGGQTQQQQMPGFSPNPMNPTPQVNIGGY